MKQKTVLVVLFAIFCLISSVLAASIGKTNDITTSVYAGQASTLITITPSSNVPSGPNMNVAISCSGGAGIITGQAGLTRTLTWAHGTSNAQTYSVTPSQAGVTWRCTYTVSGGGTYSAPSDTVFYVDCEMTGFAGVGPNMGLQNCPGAGLPCPSRVGLQAFYPFTNGIVNKDTSVYNIAPTSSNVAFATDKYGNANSAGVFNAASNSYLSSSYVANYAVWAISFWFISPNSNSDYNNGFLCVENGATPWAGANYDRCINLHSGYAYADLWNWETITSTGATFNDGKLTSHTYHYQKNVQVQQIYVDGVLRVSGTKTFSDFNWNTYIIFGWNHRSTGYYTGTLDNIAMWNRTLPSAEITSLYTSTWQDNIWCFTCGTLTGANASTPYPTFQMTATYQNAGSPHVFTVNGVTVQASMTSGGSTPSANLNMGRNVLTISAGEGTYTIIVYRVCDITSVSFNSTFLSYNFASLICGVYSYNGTVPYSSIYIAATIIYSTNLNHDFTVNGVTITSGLVSGTASAGGFLNVGLNQIVISAPEGLYYFNLTRNCDISSLSFTPPIVLAPPYQCGLASYTSNIGMLATTIAVAAVFTTGSHTYSVNGGTVTWSMVNNVTTSGGWLSSSNTLTISQVDGPLITITLNRLAGVYALAFVPDAGSVSLSPAFVAATLTGYTASVPFVARTLATKASFTVGITQFILNGITVSNNVTSGVVSTAGTLALPTTFTTPRLNNVTVISSIDGAYVIAVNVLPQDVRNFSLLCTTVYGASNVIIPIPLVAGQTSVAISVHARYDTCRLAVTYLTPGTITINSPSESWSGNAANSTQYSWHISPLPLGGTLTLNVLSSYATNVGPGLLGRYYNDLALTLYMFSRVDTTVDWDYGTGSPDPRITNVDSFSMHWVGYLTPSTTETYQVCTSADDGTRLWLDGSLLVNHWVGSAESLQCGAAALIAGTPYPIIVDYYESGGNAAMHLKWSSPSISTQVIPASALSHDLQQIDGPYVLSITRNPWDVQSIDMQTGGGPASQWGQAPLVYTPTYIHTTSSYSASVPYSQTGVIVRAMSTDSVSCEIIRSGGYLFNLMPTGWSAPIVLNVGTNLIRIISVDDNGSPYPQIGFSSYNFTVTRRPAALLGIGLMIRDPANSNTLWTSNIVPAYSPDIFTYTVDVPLWYVKAKMNATFQGITNVSISFYNGAPTLIPTSTVYTSYQTLLTGLFASQQNYFIVNSTEDGIFTIWINRPMDVKSIVAVADVGPTAYSVTPTLTASYYTYSISVPFKTQSIQLKVNYTVATKLADQLNNGYAISPNTLTASIPTTFATPVTLTMNNTYDGIYSIQIIFLPPDVTSFTVTSNLGPLTLSPVLAAGVYAYTASYYGSLSNVQFTTTYQTASPAMNLTVNTSPFGPTLSGVTYDVSNFLTSSSAYLMTGVMTLKAYSPYDGQYTIALTPSCPQPYTVTPGTAATPLCQFFASYCNGSTYVRVCLLTRPGCCGNPACLC